MWWLPWESLALTRIRIPPVPASLVDAPDEDEFPRFFMTAGINGCSAKIEGPPEAPTIFHAGITGKLARPADEFWLEQMREAQTRLGTTGKTVTAVHMNDYLGEQRPDVKIFEEWKNSTKPHGFRLEVTCGFGSLIGVRFGRYWSFYLQQNVYTQDVEVLKRNQVEPKLTATNTKYYTDKDNGRVERVDILEPRSLGPIALPDKRIKTFLRRGNQSTSVLAVGEIYPTRSFNADFTGRIRALA